MDHKPLYGLLGRVLGHSFSANYFNTLFQERGSEERYVNFELPSIDSLPRLIESNPNLVGFNVTIPYKEAILPYLDSVSEAAQELGAVNVVKIYCLADKQIKLYGDNTDWIAFAESLRPLLTPHHKRALILGQGGAGKAVAYALHSLGITYQFVSHSKRPGALAYESLTPEVMSQHQIIVNATPLGMFPDVLSCPQIPYKLLTVSHLCYDLTYNPEKTEFLKRSEQQGAAVKNGMEMLIKQAQRSYSIWQEVHSGPAIL